MRQKEESGKDVEKSCFVRDFCGPSRSRENQGRSLRPNNKRTRAVGAREKFLSSEGSGRPRGRLRIIKKGLLTCLLEDDLIGKKTCQKGGRLGPPLLLRYLMIFLEEADSFAFPLWHNASEVSKRRDRRSGQ